jgi:pyruvate dehydrogenase E2 component (dihydrolipoamide acetyltransferase)
VTDHGADEFEYAMPSLGADMDEGRVIEWRVDPGDTVHRGDLIATVETEKSDIDIEIWHDGIIEEFLVDVGQLVDVGTPIARLRTLDGASPPPAPPSTAAPSTPIPKKSAGVALSATPARHSAPRRRRRARRADGCRHRPSLGGSPLRVAWISVRSAAAVPAAR